MRTKHRLSSLFQYVVLLVAAMIYPVLLRASPLPPVTAAIIEQRIPQRMLSYLGRIEAIQSVEVTTRTEGFIARRSFADGQLVKVGDMLFEIDPAVHQAQVAQAQAQVDSASAGARLKQVNLTRIQRLGEQRTVSRADVDTAIAQRDTANAALAQAQANLRMQELQLGFTRITAPISGQISHSNIDVGSLVNPASGSLANIVQLDPIRIAIAINEQDFISAAYRQTGKLADLSAQGYLPRLRLANGQEYPERGSFESMDNRIDSQTGTVTVRARFPNPRHLLLPGGVVNVALVSDRVKPVIMTPIAALQQDRDGYFVLLLDKQNRVEVRRVSIGHQFDQEYEVKQGLTAGDRVIVEGLQRVRPGMEVEVIFATANITSTQ